MVVIEKNRKTSSLGSGAGEQMRTEKQRRDDSSLWSLLSILTSPPTRKASRTDFLPHFPLNSTEKRRRCAPLILFSCRNHAENEVKSCAADRLSLSVGGQVRRESREHRDEAGGGCSYEANPRTHFSFYSL